MVLFLSVTARQQAVIQKIRNFFTKWRQLQQKVPLPEMAELRITPQLPEYPKIANDVFMLLLDGKLRSRSEILKFLKPFAPPPPPPPPPPKRGRAKAAAAAAGTGAVATTAAPVGKKRVKGETAPPAAPPPKATRKMESVMESVKGGRGHKGQDKAASKSARNTRKRTKQKKKKRR